MNNNLILKEQFKDLALEVNSEALPNIPEKPYILLPPPEYSLTKNVFQVYDEEQNLINIQQKDKKINNDLIGKTRTTLGIKRANKDTLTGNYEHDLYDNQESEKEENIKLTSKKRFRPDNNENSDSIGLKNENKDLFNEDDEVENQSAKKQNNQNNGSEAEAEEESEEQVSSQGYENREEDFNINFNEAFYNFK